MKSNIFYKLRFLYVDVCSLPPVAGPCEALIKRYFHNATSGKCEEFYYGGCRGNDNNFKTITACERKCQRAGMTHLLRSCNSIINSN